MKHFWIRNGLIKTLHTGRDVHLQQKHRRTNLSIKFGHFEEGTYSPVVKILSSLCFPCKRGGGVDYNILLQSRDTEEEFHLLLKELKLNHCWFWMYFRISVGQFEALLQMLTRAATTVKLSTEATTRSLPAVGQLLLWEKEVTSIFAQPP